MAYSSQGFLGYIKWGGMLPEVLYAIWNNKNGKKLLGPIKTDFGYHLLYIHSEKRVQLEPFEVEKKNIIRKIQSNTFPEFNHQLKKLTNQLFQEHSVTLDNLGIDSLFSILHKDSLNPNGRYTFASIKKIKQSKINNYSVALVDGKEVFANWLIQRADIEPMLYKSSTLYLNNFKKLITDIISRDLGVKEADKLDLVDDDILNKKTQDVLKGIIVDYYTDMIKVKEGYSSKQEVFDQLIKQHKIKYNPKYLNGDI